MAKSEDCEQTDLEEFEKLLCAEKPGLGPNVDFFEYEELKELCTKFRQEKGHFSMIQSQDDGNQSRISRRSSISARSSTSMADLFEKNLGSATSGEGKPTKRRNTRTLDGTMLSKQNTDLVRVFK